MLCGSRNEMELLLCGSRSSRRTRRPLCANAAARLIVVVVLPTPPFWLAIAMIVLNVLASSLSLLGARGSHGQVPCLADHIGPLLIRRGAALLLAARNGVARRAYHFLVDENRAVGPQGQSDRVRRARVDHDRIAPTAPHRDHREKRVVAQVRDDHTLHA